MRDADFCFKADAGFSRGSALKEDCVWAKLKIVWARSSNASINGLEIKGGWIPMNDVTK